MTILDHQPNLGIFSTREISEYHFLVYQIISNFFGRFPGILNNLQGVSSLNVVKSFNEMYKSKVLDNDTTTTSEPEIGSFVKIVIQLSASLKPNVFAVHSNFGDLQNNYLALLCPKCMLIKVKLRSQLMTWCFLGGHHVHQQVEAGVQ